MRARSRAATARGRGERGGGAPARREGAHRGVPPAAVTAKAYLQWGDKKSGTGGGAAQRGAAAAAAPAVIMAIAAAVAAAR